MLKVALLLLSRKLLVHGSSISSSVVGFSKSGSTICNFSSVSTATEFSSRMSADLSIFKGNGALFVSPCTAKFVKQDSGFSTKKNGRVFLKFMPAIGTRKYDTSRKLMFALNPTEVGCLISLGSQESCEFLHDPAMKSSLEGQVKKFLSVKPMDVDGGGYLFSLAVNDTINKTIDRVTVPVSKAEFAVMRTAFSFVLPYIIGWDQAVMTQSSTAELLSITPRKNFLPSNQDPDAEWNR